MSENTAEQGYVVAHAGEVNLMKLDVELKAIDSSITGIVQQGTILTVKSSIELSAPIMLLVSAAIGSHNALDLQEYKDKAKVSADDHYEVIIERGFNYNGIMLSVGDKSRANWTGLSNMKSIITYPFTVAGLGDTTFHTMVDEAAFDETFLGIGVYYMSVFTALGTCKATIQGVPDTQSVDSVLNTYLGL